MNTTLVLAGILGLGGPELIVLVCLVIFLFGAKKLPELARGLGKAKSEFQKASAEAEREFEAGQDEANKKASDTSAPKSKD